MPDLARDQFDATKPFWTWAAPTPEQYKWLSTEAEVAADTNFLLTPYRVSPTSQDRVLSLLESLQERLFVPHQVALEYYQSRLSVVSQQWNVTAAVERLLDETLEGAAAAIRKVKDIERHATIESAAEVGDWLAQALAAVRERLRERRDQLIDPSEAVAGTDAVHLRIAPIIATRVGPPLETKLHDEVLKSGPERFEAGIPPGFEDQHKQERQFGDLIIWTEMIERARAERRPIVFVTDDQKSDWVDRPGGLRTGPLPALRAEFFARAQQHFWLYSVRQFLQFSSSFTAHGVEQGVIEEVVENTTVDLEAERSRALTEELVEREQLIASLHNSLVALTEGNDGGTETTEAVAELRARLDRELDRAVELKAALRSGRG